MGEESRATRRRHSRPRAVVVRAAGLIGDFLIQLMLVWLGVIVVFAEDDESIVFALLAWCGLGTLYWILAVTVVGAVAHRDRRSVSHPAVSWIDLNPITRIVTTVATFLASLVGVAAAVEVLLLRDDPEWADVIVPIGVWAMLLSWSLFHWGFARIYARRFRRAAEPPLRFPGTDDPGLVDFVYFAFAVATSFAVTDVQVVTTRMRWTVVWHAVFSFFLNAMIIVLAINTIIR